jgi:hypothetical protein
VKSSSRGARRVAGVVAARLSAAHVPQARRLHHGRRPGPGPGQIGDRAVDIAPVPDGPHGQDRRAPQGRRPGQHQEQGVRHDLVRASRVVRGGGQEPAGRGRADRDEQRGGGHKGSGDPAPAGQPPREPPRPGVAAVGVLAQPGEDPRRVERELVRSGVHAGGVAVLAVVAQVGQVAEVAAGEVGAQLEFGPHGTVARAVAAGVADAQLPPGLGEQVGLDGEGGLGEQGVRGQRLTRPGVIVPRRVIRGHDGPPPGRRSGPRPCRSSCRTRRDSRWTGCCRT